MSAENRWTPDHMRSPANRAIHLEQRRKQLQPLADDLRRIAREMEAVLKEEGRIEGDLPGQPWLRARHVAKPLFDAADSLEKVLPALNAFNARFQHSYEELPDRREARRQKKALAKQQAIEPSGAGEGTVPAQAGSFDDVFDSLRRGA
ncbi:hypothetical protein ACIGD1_34480 [Streptomyces sp. NPDC085612]|uniref:hypothetical protein n=1 Tax=Streptomyces sp. NPDC085612 TaxID=3365732 RepID=UPI0037D85D8C